MSAPLSESRLPETGERVDAPDAPSVNGGQPSGTAGVQATAPESEAQASPHHAPDVGPAGHISRLRLVIGTALIVVLLVGVYLLIPKIAGLQQTWGKLRHGDPLWLAAGAGLELLSIAGYAVLFRTVFGRGVPRIDWRVSLEIPLAGIAAIRLVAAAGAGGVAVTAWALARAGVSAGVIACRMVASLVLQYSVYLGALVVCGVGLWTGLFDGGGSIAITLFPAALAAVLGVGIVSLALMRGDVEDRLGREGCRPGMRGKVAKLLARAPATLGSGVRTAGGLIRQRRVGLLGAVAYWGFDIAVLGFCFHAFGTIVPVAVLIMSYFLGTLGSLLPLPGGIGGVEGGMIGAFVAFGVPTSNAVIGVLAYRAISFWLPTLPGIAGYLALRTTVRNWRKADIDGGGSAHESQGQAASP